ncbi:hypothetical protein EJB05_02212, partial [Eragrostis curvula]
MVLTRSLFLTNLWPASRARKADRKLYPAGRFIPPMEDKIQKTFVAVDSKQEDKKPSLWNIVQSSWWTSCYFLKGAAADEATKIGLAMLCCSAAQAATALLACRRAGSCCQHLAFVALALTAANQCMMARIHGLYLSAYPWDPLLTVGIVLTIVAILMDLFGFLLLILGRDDDE